MDKVSNETVNSSFVNPPLYYSTAANYKDYIALHDKQLLVTCENAVMVRTDPWKGWRLLYDGVAPNSFLADYKHNLPDRATHEYSKSLAELPRLYVHPVLKNITSVGINHKLGGLQLGNYVLQLGATTHSIQWVLNYPKADDVSYAEQIQERHYRFPAGTEVFIDRHGMCRLSFEQQEMAYYKIVITAPPQEALAYTFSPLLDCLIEQALQIKVPETSFCLLEGLDKNEAIETLNHLRRIAPDWALEMVEDAPKTVFIPLALNQWLGLATQHTFSGESYFCDESLDQVILPSTLFWRMHIKPFLDKSMT
jgi:hypothetical protein